MSLSNHFGPFDKLGVSGVFSSLLVAPTERGVTG